ncbi:hypothetical protein [Rhodothermus marinus]|uniref:hypothetical protein n=1 Tax=Rhodothermus marinus TaxID=29549 RepID=UPI000AD84488|nr:hypothetical protein [Rhodothermus marinus]
MLARLDAAPTRAWNLLPWFQLRLAAALGFAPRIERALVEQIGPEGGELALASGQVRPRFRPTRNRRNRPHGRRCGPSPFWHVPIPTRPCGCT